MDSKAPVMKPRLTLLLAIWLSGASLVYADAPKLTPVTVPKRVVVPVGGIGYLAVKVDRKMLPDKVQITLQNMPDGIVVAGGESGRTLENGAQGAATFVIQASNSSAVGLLRKIHVVVDSGDTRIMQTVDVSVVQFAMRPMSWMVMLLSVASVLVLVTFCVWRVLTLPPVERDTIAGPLEIDTRDTQNAD